MHRSASTGTVEINRVGPDELEHWADVVLRCFFEEPESPPPALREGAIAMSMVPGTTSWLARVGGQPAGGGLLMIHDGLALICGDGTLPSYRHRGVQTLLLQARLAHAAASGCKLAAICTQPGSGSQRNAERQGFQVVYARTMLIHH
jgi:GNAT superfamily N-acetyltransferase